VNYFLFQSSVLMETSIQVGRGSVSVAGSTVYVGTDLTNGDKLRTDPQSQATIAFRDSEQSDHLVAAITMQGNTNLTVWRSVRPRFHWGTGTYNIELQDFSGDLDVFIPKDLLRDVRLTVRTPQDVLADFGASGQYSISVSASQLRVVNRQGMVSIIPANSNEGRAVPVDSQGIITFDNPSEVALSPALVNILWNSTFEDVFSPPGSVGPQALALAWGCTNSTTNLPRGSYHAEIQDGRYLLRLLRAENAESHGETRCGTWFPNGGYDVANLGTLVLRASFNIQYQSLNVCGTDGSECPLMLRVDYLDANGIGHIWYHGFYATKDLQQNYPLTCDSCASEHEQVNEKTWYTYDSGNWFTLFSPDQRPTTIVNVQFYASGHQYDVYVGEVALLAG
jgi:hypothetical protein